MRGNTLRLGRVLGVELRLDYSWFIVFVLVIWSLASYYFPGMHPGFSTAAYWLMGTLTALLFFASVVAHELAHSLVSQAYGVPVRDITLFIFGGASEITSEPKTARGELLMALVGPLTSLVVAALFGSLWLISRPASSLLHNVAAWLAGINVTLALFNLIPGFPLDGGRVFRAIVWAITGNLRRATRIATSLGRLVAYGFILVGIWQILGGNWANGLWIAFIGWFLQNAATSSYRELAMRDMLAGHTAREAMTTDCSPINRAITLDVLVEQVLSRTARRCFPVEEAGEFYGLLTLHGIMKVHRQQWAVTRAEQAMIPSAQLKTVRPDEHLTTVLERLTAEDVNQFPVMGDGRFVGMLTRENLLNFIRTRAALAAD